MAVEVFMGACVDKLKRCYICEKKLTLDKFYLSKNGMYNFCCIPCDKKRKATYRAENAEKIALAENKYMNTERGYVNEVIGGIFQRAKRKTTRKKWLPDMSKQDVYDELMLYVQDHGRTCEYCKEQWTYVRRLGVRGKGHRGVKRAGIETNFSIDRLDTTKTYSRDNIVFCCVGCNNRKNAVRISDLTNILKVWNKRKS